MIDHAPIPDGGSTRQIDLIVRHVLKAEGRSGFWEVNVILVDDDELQELHRRFMSIDEPTDVMTFPFDGGALGGEIVISVDRAAEQAADYGHSTWEEVRYLVGHGLLHLCGWIDTSEEQRAAMLARQDEILSDVPR